MIDGAFLVLVAIFAALVIDMVVRWPKPRPFRSRMSVHTLLLFEKEGLLSEQQRDDLALLRSDMAGEIIRELERL